MGTHPIFESDFDCLTEMPLFAAGAGSTPPDSSEQKQYVGQIDPSIMRLKCDKDAEKPFFPEPESVDQDPMAKKVKKKSRKRAKKTKKKISRRQKDCDQEKLRREREFIFWINHLLDPFFVSTRKATLKIAFSREFTMANFQFTNE